MYFFPKDYKANVNYIYNSHSVLSYAISKSCHTNIIELLINNKAPLYPGIFNNINNIVVCSLYSQEYPYCVCPYILDTYSEHVPDIMDDIYNIIISLDHSHNVNMEFIKWACYLNVNIKIIKKLMDFSSSNNIYSDMVLFVCQYYECFKNTALSLLKLFSRNNIVPFESLFLVIEHMESIKLKFDIIKFLLEHGKFKSDMYFCDKSLLYLELLKLHPDIRIFKKIIIANLFI